MKIFDISLPITNQTVVYPKNPKVQITPHQSLPQGSSNLTKIMFGSHTGTHIDVPRHVDNDGWGVDKLDLSKCIGKCRVLDVTHVEDRVKIKDFSGYEINKGDRVLVKTKNSLRGFGQFHEDFVGLDGDAADWLSEKGIVLFGIDYLSIKKLGSNDNRPHTGLLEKDVVIFEGLDLSKVDPGEYQFIGLPLKLGAIDGAPARAILFRK